MRPMDLRLTFNRSECGRQGERERDGLLMQREMERKRVGGEGSMTKGKGKERQERKGKTGEGKRILPSGQSDWRAQSEIHLRASGAMQMLGGTEGQDSQQVRHDTLPRIAFLFSSFSVLVSLTFSLPAYLNMLPAPSSLCMATLCRLTHLH